MASVMDVDEEEVEMASSSSGKGDKKRFEVKKVYIHKRILIVTVGYSFVGKLFIILLYFPFSGMQSLYGLGVCFKYIF